MGLTPLRNVPPAGQSELPASRRGRRAVGTAAGALAHARGDRELEPQRAAPPSGRCAPRRPGAGQARPLVVRMEVPKGRERRGRAQPIRRARERGAPVAHAQAGRSDTGSLEHAEQRPSPANPPRATARRPSPSAPQVRRVVTRTRARRRRGGIRPHAALAGGVVRRRTRPPPRMRRLNADRVSSTRLRTQRFAPRPP
jgi:hypothetical protein